MGTQGTQDTKVFLIYLRQNMCFTKIDGDPNFFNKKVQKGLKRERKKITINSMWFIHKP